MVALADTVSSPPGALGNVSIRSAVDATFDPNVGFLCDLDGALSYRLRGDAALKVMVVQAGRHYRLDIAEFDIDASVTNQIITVFFRTT